MIDLIQLARGLPRSDFNSLRHGRPVIISALINHPEELIMLHTLRFVCATQSHIMVGPPYATVRETLGTIARAAPQHREAYRALSALRAILDYQSPENQPDLMVTLRRLDAAKAPLIQPESFIEAMRNAEHPGTARMAEWLRDAFQVAEMQKTV